MSSENHNQLSRAKVSTSRYKTFSLAVLKRSIIAILALIAFSFYTNSISYADFSLESLNPTLVAHFERSISEDFPKNIPFEVKGGHIITDGVQGKALSLGKKEYLRVNAAEVINPSEGSIIFWVRPHSTSSNKTSNTFVSFAWEGEPKSYFVISKGWWEKSGGSSFTYFIYNNQQSAKTEKQILYEKGKWVHIACTWRVGNDGFVRLYVNGLLVGEGHKKPLQAFSTAGKLYLGADKGAPMSEDRWGDCDIDELAFFNRALQDVDILRIYNGQTPQKYKPLRDSKGQTIQTRAMFDEGRGWMTRAGAEETIQRIKKAGFNAYIPCVWHGQGTRYPSPIGPSEQGPASTAGDPLKYLINIAHKNGIEVYPWFTVALRQREFLKEYYDEGTPKDAFNLHNADFREFIIKLIIDVVERYEVDGINLDFIRTMGICKSAFCQEQYKKIYHRDLLEDLKISNLNNRLNEHVQAWVDNAVEDVVREISKRSRRTKPGLILSVDGHPIPKNLPPSPQGRNEVLWANKGLIDVIFSMDYERAPNFDKFELIRRELLVESKLVPLISNYEGHPKKGIKPRNGIHLAELMKYSLTRMPQGVGIYIYSQLTDEQVDVLSSIFNQKSITHLRVIHANKNK